MVRTKIEGSRSRYIFGIVWDGWSKLKHWINIYLGRHHVRYGVQWAWWWEQRNSGLLKICWWESLSFLPKCNPVRKTPLSSHGKRCTSHSVISLFVFQKLSCKSCGVSMVSIYTTMLRRSVNSQCLHLRESHRCLPVYLTDILTLLIFYCQKNPDNISRSKPRPI